MDETGIDSYLCREYGYAPRGELLHDQIAGRKYARTGIVAAQMGQEILAPCSYDGTMNHELFGGFYVILFGCSAYPYSAALKVLHVSIRLALYITKALSDQGQLF